MQRTFLNNFQQASFIFLRFSLMFAFTSDEVTFTSDEVTIKKSVSGHKEYLSGLTGERSDYPRVLEANCAWYTVQLWSQGMQGNRIARAA